MAEKKVTGPASYFPSIEKKYGKPILIATELAVADPANPGPAKVRETGRLCYPSGARAAYALAQMVRYSDFRSTITL